MPAAAESAASSARHASLVGPALLPPVRCASDPNEVREWLLRPVRDRRCVMLLLALASRGSRAPATTTDSKPAGGWIRL